METQTELKAFTSGFSARVDTLFDALGIRTYGRGALLAEWTGLTRAGARKMYTEDRPPKSDEAMKGMSAGFASVAANSGKWSGVTGRDIEQYLLQGGVNPLKQNTKVEKRRSFSKLDTLAQAKIFMLIDERVRKVGFNALTDLPPSQVESLVEKVAEVHTSQNLDPGSKQMTEIVDALIKLAQSNVLIS